MQVKKLNLADLNNYQKIPMLKKFSSIIHIEEDMTMKETKILRKSLI